MKAIHITSALLLTFLFFAIIETFSEYSVSFHLSPILFTLTLISGIYMLGKDVVIPAFSISIFATLLVTVIAVCFSIFLAGETMESMVGQSLGLQFVYWMPIMNMIGTISFLIGVLSYSPKSKKMTYSSQILKSEKDLSSTEKEELLIEANEG